MADVSRSGNSNVGAEHTAKAPTTDRANLLTAKPPQTANTPTSDQRSPDNAPGTLGELLFQSSAPIAPESEWVALVHAIATGNQTALRDLYDRSHRIAYTL